MGAKLLLAKRQTDRQTDRHNETNNAFRKFANAPKNTSISADLKNFRAINNSANNDEKEQERH
jgi:hypothetical protein